MQVRIVHALADISIKVLARRMASRSGPERIRAYIHQKGFRRAVFPLPVDRRSLPVAVVQERIVILRDYRAFADRMHSFAQQAADQGARLVCFPEENGMLLLGQLPFIDGILNLVSRRIKRLGATGGQKDSKIFLPAPGRQPQPAVSARPQEAGAASLPGLLAGLTPFLRSSFEATFSQLAAESGLYIMAGSLTLYDGGKLLNRAYLFGPDGELVGTQDKAHPTKMELDMGITGGNALRVFPTSLARLAFPVCMDATYFETFKILKQLGAEIVIVPIANMEPYEADLALRGIWPRVQESGLYGVKSALVGDFCGLPFTGKAGVYAPMDLTGDRSGVIAEARTFDQDEVVTACLDLNRLDTYASDYFNDSNPTLYRRYFPDIYRNLL